MVTKKKKQAIVDEALDRFDIAADAWEDVYQAALDDVAFVDEEDGQWDSSAKMARVNRP